MLLASAIVLFLWISYILVGSFLVFVIIHRLEQNFLNGYNAGMQKTGNISSYLLLLATMLLTACSPSTPVVINTLTSTVDGTLRPYPTDTATVTPLPTGYSSPTPSPTVTPTATQVFYEVQLGDDMYSIGYRYKVHPDAIMTANPEVNPRAMGVGTTLLIPVTPSPEPTPTTASDPTPTPTQLAVDLITPDCYPESIGGLWCFVLVENEEDTALENISAEVILRIGDEERREIAIMPLNLLPAGEALPLIVYFQPPLPEDYSVTASITFMLPVMPDDQRYLPVVIEDQSIVLNEDQNIAIIEGDLFLPAGHPATRYIWVNATAFDEEGHVVAVRRWESDVQLSAGEKVPFELALYSMGNAIDRVSLLVEARGHQPSSDDE